MQITHSRNDVARWLRYAAAQVEMQGRISAVTQVRLENAGVSVGELERRLLDNKEPGV